MSRPDLSKLPEGSDTEWWVYSHVARDGRVLYVGSSSKPRSRNRAHQAAKWWPKVETVGLLGPWRVKRAALDAERDLIRALDPEFNITHTPRRAERARRTTRRNSASVDRELREQRREAKEQQRLVLEERIRQIRLHDAECETRHIAGCPLCKAEGKGSFAVNCGDPEFAA